MSLKMNSVCWKIGFTKIPANQQAQKRLSLGKCGRLTGAIKVVWIHNLFFKAVSFIYDCKLQLYKKKPKGESMLNPEETTYPGLNINDHIGKTKYTKWLLWSPYFFVSKKAKPELIANDFFKLFSNFLFYKSSRQRTMLEFWSINSFTFFRDYNAFQMVLFRPNDLWWFTIFSLYTSINDFLKDFIFWTSSLIY
jgi:hypothetical protein